MQDAGSKKDMALNSEGLSLSSRELPGQSLGHCQSVGNWIAPSSVIKALHGILYSDSFLLEKHPVNALTIIQFADMAWPIAGY